MRIEFRALLYEQRFTESIVMLAHTNAAGCSLAARGGTQSE
ncbi:hypothetical protein ACFPN2_05420 [Steroidobacter flavus]|uniref:Uncharacterized protein n=1 Tax=Steroidobacter flavus TaxID=1842136 RepID=A0ABV8SMD3_9GAMM